MTNKQKNLTIVILVLLVVGCVLGNYMVEKNTKEPTLKTTSEESNKQKSNEVTVSNSKEQEEPSNSNSNSKSNSNSSSNNNSNSNVKKVSNSNTTSNSNNSNTSSITTKNVVASGKVNGKTIKVDDRCEVTAQVIEEYYSDSEYTYYFNSAKSGCTYVIVDNNEYTIKNALTKNKVTPAQLESIGYKLNKVKNSVSIVTKNVVASGKVNGKTVKVDDRCEVTAQAIEEYYSDGEYTYYFNSMRSGCTYVIVDNNEYTIKNAFLKNIVTPAQLESIGYKLNKFKKSEKY